MYRHTGSIARENINNISRNVCNSISTTSAPDSLANVLMNRLILMPTVMEEKIYINENHDINNILMVSDADFSLIENNIANPPMPNKALVELFNACSK